MEFLKRHYEKLILLLLLLAFIGSMFHVLNIISQTREIKDSDLQIPTRQPDYQTHEATDPVFDVAGILKSTSVAWTKSGARRPEFERNSSDLIYVFPIARCPLCNKLIPYVFMEQEEVCPFCKNLGGSGKFKGTGEKFPKPITVKPFEFPVTELDKDGDGIPDEVETKFGLDPRNKADARFDMDGDGFSNVYEYLEGFQMNNFRSRPPLWRRLEVSMIGKVPLPLKFTALNKADSTDPAKWEITIRNEEKNYNDLFSIGRELDLDKKRYVIKSIDGEKDKEALHLQEVGGSGEIVMHLNEPVMSLTDKAVLKDSLYPNNQIIANVGDVITIGDRRTGSERYRVKTVNAEKLTVLLEDPTVYEGDATKDKKGVVMLVTRSGNVPEHMKIQLPKEGENMMYGEYGPNGPFGPMSPPNRYPR